MERPTLQLLLIEDNPGDADLVKDMLADASEITISIYWANTLLAGLDRLAKGDIELVLLDVSLPDSHGLDGLNAIRIHAPDVPVVLLTGWDNESLALRAVQVGAQDYLVKGKLDSATLVRSLRRSVVRQQTQADSPKTDSQQQPGKVLGYLGAKGGVGTSTIVCHISKELNRLTTGRVLVMDMSGGANSIGFLMRVEGAYTILDASSDILHLDPDRWQKLVVQAAPGVDVIQSAAPPWQDELLPKPERIRFILRFVRSLYQWIVVDLGRLGPLSTRAAREVGQLFLVSTCDVLSLNEAQGVLKGLHDAGLERDSIQMVLNQAPRRLGFQPAELQQILGAPIHSILPESKPGFGGPTSERGLLVESSEFKKLLSRMAAGIAGLKEDDAKGPFSFLTGLRHAAK